MSGHTLGFSSTEHPHKLEPTCSALAAHEKSFLCTVKLRFNTFIRRHNKQRRKKVLIDTFHFISHILKFLPHAQALEPLWTENDFYLAKQ